MRRSIWFEKRTDQLIIEDTAKVCSCGPNLNIPLALNLYTDDRIAEFTREERQWRHLKCLTSLVPAKKRSKKWESFSPTRMLLFADQ